MSRTSRTVLILSACGAVFFCSADAAAQLGVEWVARYDGGGRALEVNDSGNVYVTGYNATIKYSPAGDTLWVRSGASGRDIAVDSMGYVYVTGTMSRDTMATVKYTPDGDTVWVRHYTIWPNGTDFGSAIAVDDSGFVYVTGNSKYSLRPPLWQYTTIKYSPDGDSLWLRAYRGPWDDPWEGWAHEPALAVDNGGNVYVTGQSQEQAIVTIKYSPFGDTVWVREGEPGFGRAIAIDDSGYVYVAGRGGGEYSTIKYSPLGDTVWVRHYNGLGSAWDQAHALAVDDSGNVYVTGITEVVVGFDHDYTTIKYSPLGDTLWVRQYSGPGDADRAVALAVDDSGNVYVTGYGNAITRDYATISYSSDGDTNWVRRYNGPGNRFDYTYDLAVDHSGNAYVTGYSDGSDSLSDYATIKYSNPTGDVNCDGIIDLVDVVLFGNHLDGLTSLDGTCSQTQADVDLDGDVDEDDYTMLFDNLDHDVDGIVNGVDNCPAIYNPEQETTVSLPGDANQDDVLTAADIIHDVNFVFRGGATPLPCEASGDVTCDGVVNSSDLINLVNHVFKSGSPPCEVCEEYGLGWTCP